jgi:hypothetical protein
VDVHVRLIKIAIFIKIEESSHCQDPKDLPLH